MFYHEESKDGLVCVCRLALYSKYPKYSTEGFEALYSRPPVIYISSSTPPRDSNYICLQLSLPMSSVCSVPCNTLFGSNNKMMPNQDRNLKWSVQLLYAHICPLLIVVIQKIILMLQLTRINTPVPQQQKAQQQQQQPDPQSITIPLLYNIQENTITLVEKGPTLPNANLQQVSQHLKKFMERFHPNTDCA